MKWDSTKVFDLTSFSCVDEWDYTTSIKISDSQYSISPVWRGFDYYVDVTSEKVVELGTKQYPFKHLGLAFVEILNFHANTNRAINIYLLENTVSYIDLGFNYIINISSVSIIPYSLTSSTPSKVTITAGEINEPTQSNISSYFNTGTRFNILQSTELRKDNQIFSNSLFTSSEQSLLAQRTQVIIAHRSCISIKNIIFKSIFNDINSNYVLFMAIYLQNKTFDIVNADFRTSGGIFKTYDPIVLNMENIDVDFMNNVYGFDITPSWNYPEAYLEGGLNITNIKVYYSSGNFNVHNLLGYWIRYTGPGYNIINGYYSGMYSRVFVDNGLSFLFVLQPVWIPNVDTPQYLNFSNIQLPLNYSNPFMNLVNMLVRNNYKNELKISK